MLSPLPRRSGWAHLFAHSPPAVSAFPERVVGSACASSFSRFARRSLALRPAHSRCHQFVTRIPKASAISSPPQLLRLLPAGAVAGWALHPLESAALSRRTPQADSCSAAIDDEFAETCGQSAFRDETQSLPSSPRQRRLVIAAVDALLLDQPATVELHAEIVIVAHGVERPGVRGGKRLHHFPIGAHRNPVRGALERYMLHPVLTA